MTSQLIAVSVDATDPIRLARFWAELLDWELAAAEPGGPELQPDDDTGFRFRFVPAAEPPGGPKQMHFHLTSTSPADRRSAGAVRR